MQQPLDKERHRSLVPRLVSESNPDYASSNYTHMQMREEVAEDVVRIFVKTGLATKNDCCLDCFANIEYCLDAQGMKIRINHAQGMRLILPLIAGDIAVQTGSVQQKEQIFFLTGGFIADEIIVRPDENGEIELRLFE